MITRCTTLTAAFIVASMSSVAQQNGPPRSAFGISGSVTGRVVDGQSAEPIISASVALWNSADSTLVTGAITDPSGRFEVEPIREGAYFVKVSFVGFTSRTVSDVVVRPGATDVDLGRIALGVNTEMLEEVEVTAERSFIEVGIDRTVYNTRDQIVSAGGSAVDVLQNIPSVEVDIEGQISLRGNQNVAILINGRPAPMQGAALASFLQGLSGETVERVEVIPNPSAKYEPDGMAGILNIVLKKEAELGLNGSLTTGFGTREEYNASSNVNFQRGKVNVFANYGFRYDTRDVTGFRYRENRFLDPLTTLDQSDIETRNSLSHVANATLDYRIGTNSTLSASSLVSTRPSEEDELTDYLSASIAGGTLDRFDRRALSRSTGLNSDNSLSFRRVVESSRDELLVELRFSTDAGDEDASFTEQDRLLPDFAIRELQRNTIDRTSRDGSLQIDYTHPALGGKVELGYKGSLRHLDNAFFSETRDEPSGAFVADENLNNQFGFDEQVHAAYGILGREFGALGVQVGVRAEQAMTEFDLLTTSESFDNNYFSLFPSAFLTYKLSPTRQVKASYSKRINRPGTWQLNPFNSYEDPLNRRIGNPYLAPEYVHAFEAGITRFSSKSSVTLSPYFRRTVDVIRRYLSIDDDGVVTMTFENFDVSDSYGAEAIGTLQLGGRMNAYASFNAYQVVTDGSNVESSLTNSAFGWTTRMNATVTIMPTLDVQVSYFYRAPMNIEGGRIDAFTRTDLALRQKVLNSRGNLSLRLSDPFNQSGFSLWRADERFYLEFDRKWQSRMAVVSFTYNFGDQKNQRVNRRRDNGGGGGGGVDIDF